MSRRPMNELRGFEDWLGFALFWGIPLLILVVSAIAWMVGT